MGAAHSKRRDSFSQKDYYRSSGTGRPSPPGKPFLVPNASNTIPDVLTIQWEAPYDHGGSRIIGYLVEHRRTGSPHWVRATPALVRGTELVLSGLEPGWRYHFRVSAENAAGLSEPGPLSEPFAVTLHRQVASAPFFYQELHDATALENEKVEFTVRVEGTPTPQVAWYHDGFEIFSNRRQRIVTNGDASSLIIYEAAMSDEGEIKCTATNRAGHAQTKAKLVLEAPPTIRLSRQYEDGLLFEKDEIIRLKVYVGGRPSPTVCWYHNGELLSHGGRYEISFVDKYATLRVAEAKRGDRGEYTLRAYNNISEDTASFLVTVTDRPEAPDSIQVVMTLGRSVTLSWSEPKDDGGCKIGNYIIEYNRIGWNVWLKAATCRQLTTTLVDLIEGSKYRFRVKAENPYGVSEPSRESDVIFIPDPKRGLLEPPGADASSRLGNYTIDSVNLDENKPARFSGVVPEIVVSEDRVVSHRRSKRKATRSHEASPSPEVDSGISVVPEIDFEIPEIEAEKPVAPIKKPRKKVKKPEVPVESGSRLESPPGGGSVASETAYMSAMYDFEMGTSNSELMLVLLPDKSGHPENEGANVDRESYLSDFDDLAIAPPMSLSAPELGSCDYPDDVEIRNAVSSTELLHEKAMARFYQAFTEDEMDRLKKLERRHSFGSRSSLGKNKQVNEMMIENRLQKAKLEKDTLLKRSEIAKPDVKPQESSLRKTGLGTVPEQAEPKELKPRDRRTVPEVKIQHSTPEITRRGFTPEPEERKGGRETRQAEDRILSVKLKKPLKITFGANVYNSSLEANEQMDDVNEPLDDVSDEDDFDFDTRVEGRPPLIAETFDEVEELEESDEFETRPEAYRPRSRTVTTKPPTRTSDTETYHPRNMIPVPRPSVDPQTPHTDRRSRSRSPLSRVSADSSQRAPPEPKVQPPPRGSSLPRKDTFSEIIIPPDVHLPSVNTLEASKANGTKMKSESNILKPILKRRPSDDAAGKAPIAVVESELNIIPKALSSEAFGDDLERRTGRRVRIEEPASLDRKSKSVNFQDAERRVSGVDPDPRSVLISHYSDIVREFGKLKKAPKTLYLNYEDLKAAAQEVPEAVESVEDKEETEIDSSPEAQAPESKMLEVKPEPEVVEEVAQKTVLSPEEEEKLRKVEKKVSSLCDYVMDLGLFLVACYFYFFDNALYSIPFLVLMLCRQVQETVQEKIRKWRKPKEE
nr:PREDICTED: uncharacterized protein LOC109030469 isoform X1 [Bemisia tabaci]